MARPLASSHPARIPPRPPPLLKLHETFTNGGYFWRDDYLLERWARSEQPVVYLGDVYHGYELKLRLGHWCWLTRDPASGEFLTIKFLSLPSGPIHDGLPGMNELPISPFVKQHCQSPFVSTIKTNFRIPHHLSKIEATYKHVAYDAIVYPVTGTDLRRLSTHAWAFLENPNKVPLPPGRRKETIRDLTLGLAALHEIGIAHGDIHPGNVTLAPPSAHEIERYLATRPPAVDEVRRKDGAPTDPTLPCRVTEHVDIGFGHGHASIIDLGYAFHTIDGRSYSRDYFPQGTPLPPELLGNSDATTNLPFKVDSWQLGLCMFFILTHGKFFIYRWLRTAEEDWLNQHRQEYAELSDAGSELCEKIPADLREGFRPILLSLLCPDPARRASVKDIARHQWLIQGDGRQ
ncbi:kinase-like domain-containing protein [Staphylotrichum tortipilum]|uniref:Kinase-like domain-containing protein n=1 Tax=Staphylotrichum tortipilum TaxID=2831512 RepID=A0AAN6RR29_9PEZI|nr:kinase-like domain-containing protein [Staphylotrichum longicolle]